jgi:hypothetical protein
MGRSIARRLAYVVVIALLRLPPESALGGEVRSWSDLSGTVTFRAEFMSTDGNWVHVRREDGGLARIPLEWLSVSDKEYVRHAAGYAAGNIETKPRRETSATAEGGTSEKAGSLEAPASLELPPRTAGDKTVEDFIAYDVGRLGGQEGAQARENFSRLGTESVGPLIRGLNEAAKIGSSCPIVVLRSKLSCCLAQANDPRLDVMAACNLCCGVPRNAPHYRSLCDLRSQCIGRLPATHPLRLHQDRVDALLAEKDDSAIDRALRSDNAIERHAAVTAACSMGPRFGRELITAISDPLPEVRQEARAGLVAMATNVDFGPDEPANERVRATATQKWDEWYREKVRFALPPAAWRLSRTKLKALLKSESEESRMGAVLVIRYRRHFMVQDLLGCFDDSSQAVRREAHNALIELADGADHGPADFTDAAEVESAVERWKLWEERRSRRFRNSAKTDEQIIREMISADDEVRLAAVTTAAMRHLSVANELVICISDPLPEVRQAARQGLVHLAEGADFGPSEGAGVASVGESSARWKRWLSTYVPPKPAIKADKVPAPR